MQQAAGKTLTRDMKRRLMGERAFISWDGEGITQPPSGPCGDVGCHCHINRQDYVLFGCSTGDELIADSLSTIQCLNLIIKVEQENPDAIHCIFAGTYDVNMILKDLHYMTMERLHATGKCQYGGFRITWAKGKFFRVTRKNVTATIFDVWAFFATSFVKACQEYLGDDETLQKISVMKNERDSFTNDDLNEMVLYYHRELDYLVKLMQKLRQNLLAAGVQLNSWHGPGAIASFMLREQGMKSHKMDDSPPKVLEILQHAYAGGRSEMFKGGHIVAPVYQYDINSAYPAAMVHLPSLRGATWRRIPCVRDASEVVDYGLYHIRAHTEWNPSAEYHPNPLYWRAKTGAVYFPGDVEGWYWGPEAKLLLGESSYTEWRILDAYILEHQGVYPFQWVEDKFAQRRAWKAAGNPAHYANKLGLNSMYGKLAQRINGMRAGAPAWHQLEWAGWITSYTRAQLYRAMMQHPEAVISCSTDSVYSLVPLDLPIGTGLGEWEYEVSDGIMILQSGVYWLLNDGEWKAKYRGFDKGSLTYDDGVEYLGRIDSFRGGLEDTPTLGASSKRFKTWGATNGGRDWRKWVTEPRELEFAPWYAKRAHATDLCGLCVQGVPLTESLHPMVPNSLPWVGRSMSAAHSLPWSDYGLKSEWQDIDLGGDW